MASHFIQIIDGRNSKIDCDDIGGCKTLYKKDNDVFQTLPATDMYTKLSAVLHKTAAVRGQWLKCEVENVHTAIV